MNSQKRGGAALDRIVQLYNKGEEAVALLPFLQTELRQISRTRIKSLLKYGHIRIEGIADVRHDTPVAPGAEVLVNLARPFVSFSHPRIKLVYEDDDIIVINKGYGLLSMGTPSAKRDVTAYSVLKDYVKKQNPLNKIFIVHRLDRDTSGLMMFAKTPKAKEAMQHNWNNMVLERRYVAVLEGVLEEDSGAVRSYLDETRQFEVYSTHEKGKGQLAQTLYRVLGRGGGYSLVEFSLDTGRKNQIRVHAHDMGHPIVGDRKYGAVSSPIHRLALHARTLRFVHPITRKDMRFELPVPARFNSLIKK
ncbi:MAG: RluA family pseudouridine synthase [Prevotella sp.]|nr:RluA family pseudouridine synthase [Prevotella sp.]MCM1074589.1 RluA family pseudouridine synthase [Ruminococcus sp.]